MRKNTTHAVAAAAMFPIFLAVLFAVTFLTSCEPEKQTAQSPPLPSSVSITVAGGAASSFTLKVGERVQLSADITPSNAGNKNVTWISSEPTIVSVSADGLAEALLDGRAVITVTTEAGSVTADIAFTVIAAAAPTVAVSGVSITNKNGAAVATLSLIEGQTAQLAAKVEPQNATIKDVSWSSSDAGVASVSGTGLVTAVKAGSAKITVTTQDGKKTASADVSVISATTAANRPLRGAKPQARPRLADARGMQAFRLTASCGS